MAVEISKVKQYLDFGVDKNVSFKYQVTVVCQKTMAIVIGIQKHKNYTYS